MEELIVILGQGFHTRSGAARNRATSANETAAWRAPGATRFDSRPANDVGGNDGGPNDFLTRADAVMPRAYAALPSASQSMPRWLVLVIGAVVAALLGGVIGGMMSV